MNDWNELKWWGSLARDHITDSLLLAEGYHRKILPPYETRYKAFELTPFNEVRCVILGQDPYHTPGMANGLAFSVSPHVRRLPPSLRNIFQEYQSDLGFPAPRFGDLTPWARQGVLLLNTILTVEAGKPLSHKGVGWEKLTIEVVQKLSKHRPHIIWLLWGKNAQEYVGLIENGWVIASSHPSPFSANVEAPIPFLGSRPFSITNRHLRDHGLKEIDWRLP